MPEERLNSLNGVHDLPVLWCQAVER